jgi:2-oxoglutarate ferredoxin oxidoreductase subunit beta
MLYIIENNGVYGLTKGQFSASADRGSKSKRGEENKMRSIDPASTAIALGGSFVARSFSGDREQLVTLIKAGIKHRGCAVLDVVSPCVTFNDHVGSTKSYAYTRANYNAAVGADYIPPAAEITAKYQEGEVMPVTLHDGSRVLLRKLDPSYIPTLRSSAMRYLEAHSSRGEVVTGLLYINEDMPLVHDVSGTADGALTEKPFSLLNPGSKALADLQKRLR